MATQTVFRLKLRNGFEGLQTFAEPIPTPGRYEVLVRVRGVALNYRDVAIAASKHLFPTKDNVVPCSDMAGEVVQVGELAREFGFAVGDAVLAPVNPSFLYGSTKPDGFDGVYGGAVDGVLTEHIVVLAQALVKLPRQQQDPVGSSSLSPAHDFARWACLVCAGGTAWNALYGNVALKPGDTVVVQGTGGVSLSALVLARAAGATTIVTSSSDAKLELVRARFGADHTVNYKTHPDWAAEVQRITQGRGADHVIDVGGAGTLPQSLECVAVGGVISVVGFLGANVPQADMPDLAMGALSKACVVRGIMAGSKQQLEELVKFVAARNLPSLVDDKGIFPFTREGVIDAYRYVASGKHVGKVCIGLD